MTPGAWARAISLGFLSPLSRGGPPVPRADDKESVMGCGCSASGRASGKKKRIRVDRDAHRRRGYFRKDGTWVRPTTVKRAVFLEKDPGKPGRLARGSKSGPYRAPRHPKWIQHRGALGGPGYAKKTTTLRHKLLARSVDHDGYATTMRRLSVLTRPVALSSKVRKTIVSDMAWLRRTYR